MKYSNQHEKAQAHKHGQTYFTSILHVLMLIRTQDCIASYALASVKSYSASYSSLQIEFTEDYSFFTVLLKEVISQYMFPS